MDDTMTPGATGGGDEDEYPYWAQVPARAADGGETRPWWALVAAPTPEQLAALRAGPPPAGVTESRALHYVAYNGRCLAGTVIGHEGSDAGRPPRTGTVDLALHTNLRNVSGDRNFGTQYHQDVPHSAGMEPGTWHYPTVCPKLAHAHG